MEQRADNSAYTSQGKVILGCVPVALGQAIAFKKYDYLPAISAMWNDINNIGDITGTRYEDVVAQYLSDLAYRLRISITPTGTNSKEWKMLKYLDSVKNIHKINFEHIEKPGYSTMQEKDILMNYFSDAVQKKDPVIIMSEVKTKEGTAGHAFVVDGVKYSMGELYEIIGTEYGGGINKMYNTLGFKHYLWINCNWGWGGNSDGLYDYENLKIRKYDYTFTDIYSFTRLK
ncbi:MAG: C10 family peptidase [Rikenellaceae bacterium]|nr:C10 family peptidase [Rikenellaceae bacterium]